MNTAFYDVFKAKHDKLREQLTEELKREKNVRRKDFIRRQIKEIRELQAVIDQIEQLTNVTRTCPKCGHAV